MTDCVCGVLQFKQYGLSLGIARDYLSNSSKPLHKAFVDYFAQVAKLLGAGNDTYRQAEELWAFETELAKVRGLCTGLVSHGVVFTSGPLFLSHILLLHCVDALPSSHLSSIVLYNL